MGASTARKYSGVLRMKGVSAGFAGANATSERCTDPPTVPGPLGSSPVFSPAGSAGAGTAMSTVRGAAFSLSCRAWCSTSMWRRWSFDRQKHQSTTINATTPLTTHMTMITTVTALNAETAAPKLSAAGPDEQSLPLKPALHEQKQFGSQPVTAKAFPKQSKIFEQANVPDWHVGDAMFTGVEKLLPVVPCGIFKSRRDPNVCHARHCGGNTVAKL